jgi:hypothetical protein
MKGTEEGLTKAFDNILSQTHRPSIPNLRRTLTIEVEIQRLISRHWTFTLVRDPRKPFFPSIIFSIPYGYL